MAEANVAGAFSQEGDAKAHWPAESLTRRAAFCARAAAAKPA